MNPKVIAEAFPLSPMQQGMLFHYLKEPHSGVDIEQVVIHLPEAIDVRRLQTAWRWLVNRHDILRAQFVWEGVEHPQQEVLPEVAVPFEVEDARQLSAADQHERLQSFLKSDRLRGFDLDHAPLLRLTLFCWADASFSLVWTFHHALLDGRCFPILLREGFESYAELEKGEIAARPTPFSYQRYIEWLAKEDFAAAEPYWKNLLCGFSAPTALTVDRKTPSDAVVYQQGEAWEIMDCATTAQLRKLAKEHSLSVNSLVMGAWAILLHRYSGEEDIVFGATRACRKSSVENADETVGLFINTAPVRVRLGGEEEVLSIFKQVRQQWLEMRPYEHTPLARVKAYSQVPPGRPLFESLLVFENYRLDTAMRSLGGGWAEREVELHELTNFPITLAAYDGEELSLKIEFDRRRLDDLVVQRLLGHLRCLLEGAAANPLAKVRDLSLIGEAERQELISGFNVPALEPPGDSMPIDGYATLHGLFEAQVVRRPQSVALTCDRESLTYQELNSRANQVARELVKFGVKPDTLVGLCLDRSNELVIAILAVLKAGGAYLPIDLAYPADRLAVMLEDAQAPVLLTESKLTGKLPSTKAKVLCLDEVLAEPGQGEEIENLPPVAGPDNLAYVIYTSGTTGKPKGSLITHRNAVRLFPATEPWYGFNERDVWTLFHSSAFDFSVWEIWGALLYGGRVVVVPFMVSRSPEAFYELLSREQVTVLNQTPSAFRQLIQAEESVGQKQLALRYVIFGGEALEMQSLRPWFDRHGDQKPQLVNMYGITETTVHVTYRPLSKDDLVSGSVIGVPIPDLQIYILDAQRQPVPIGVPGEMYVGGAGLARGYLRRPELTAERFVPDHLTGRPNSRLYKTGDLARFLPGRDIEYLGRIDDQVKIRGFRIEPGEIESVLCQHSAVREAAVMAREDVPGTKRLVAYLVASQPVPEVGELREHLKQKLPEYMVPVAFMFLGKLPLTNNGKIDRKALPVPEQQRPDLVGRYVEPRTPAEKALAAIWAKILRVEQIGIDDNFFELGGDSILSIQIISAARREGMKLTPKLLFSHQTIATLAAVAEVTEFKPAIQELVVGSVPLTPIQEWFFAQNLEEAAHYNQAFMLEVSEPLDRLLLESAIQQVSRHHDALRLRYVREGESWLQSFSSTDEPTPLDWVDLGDLSEAEQRQSIENAAASIQGGLNLNNGPLWRVIYFDLGSARAGRLLVAVHHLAIDGISWRPLLEDLETAYLQLKAGQAVILPSKTTSYKNWAEKVKEFSSSSSLQSELPYWKKVTNSPHPEENWKFLSGESSANTEGSARVLKSFLTVGETQALLQQVPAAYNTQINDVLLTALAQAWNELTGSRELFTNLEGHGRENLFEDTDLSRTVGWFTSIFPVRLQSPETQTSWQPGDALKSVKEQLRHIPRRGIGYGILKYLKRESSLAEGSEPAMVFNYLGQFDQVIEGSKLFRFAADSTGSWHSPKQRRRHALEVNCQVIGGRLELRWTCNSGAPSETAISQLAERFLAALRDLIIHCQSPQVGGRTPSDFPLARLDQPTLDRLVGGRRDIEDVYALSPIQTLFYSTNPGAVQLAFDQWQCTLHGELNVAAFQRAWLETLRRHTVLRSTIHGEGQREPVQMVHRDVQPLWTVEDWRASSSAQSAERWASFLKQDRAQPLDLTKAPVMRFALIRLDETTWKFLWSVPALLLDGWSWPVVFRDASRLYESLSQGRQPELEPVRPYRDYLEWLSSQSSEEATAFWREALAGFDQPTLLPGELPNQTGSGERYVEHVVQLLAETTDALQATARRLHLTLNTLVQGAWALLLGRQTRSADIVFGAAFAGRPADIRGVESIVGPFVNNLPIRVTVDLELTAGEFLRQLHARLLQLSPFQYSPLIEIQRVSEVPWRHRLFGSLVVFQNYLVDESARRFGGQIRIEDFAGPIHTNYPITLLAGPGAELRLNFIYDRESMAHSTVERWGRDLAVILERLPRFTDQPLADLQELLSQPVKAAPRTRAKLRTESQDCLPPQTEMERTIAGIWQRMFGVEQVSVEENLFDLGGHSLLLVRMHQRLRETLKTEFPLVELFQYPTVRELAHHLDQAATSVPKADERWQKRAQRQKQALAQLRNTLRK
jgi:amino acid adenylation domain-containing protein/non-ribosomal peptide synthase protein (TIGR01720 family)